MGMGGDDGQRKGNIGGCGDRGNTPNLTPPQYEQQQQCRQHTNRDRVRLALRMISGGQVNRARRLVEHWTRRGDGSERNRGGDISKI